MVLELTPLFEEEFLCINDIELRLIAIQEYKSDSRLCGCPRFNNTGTPNAIAGRFTFCVRDVDHTGPHFNPISGRW